MDATGTVSRSLPDLAREHGLTGDPTIGSFATRSLGCSSTTESIVIDRRACAGVASTIGRDRLRPRRTEDHPAVRRALRPRGWGRRGRNDNPRRACGQRGHARGHPDLPRHDQPIIQANCAVPPEGRRRPTVDLGSGVANAAMIAGRDQLGSPSHRRIMQPGLAQRRQTPAR